MTQRLAIFTIVVSVLVGLGAVPAVAGPTSLPVAVSVLAAPQPVVGTDQRTHLVYELLVRNGSDRDLRLDRLVVSDRGVLVTLDGEQIAQRLFSFGDEAFTRTLAPDGSGMLLLDVTLARGQRLPHRLHHRIDLAIGGDGDTTVTGATTPVERRTPLRLGLPLAGDNLAVLGCCGPPFGHRRASIVVDGDRYVAQRFAVDLVRLDSTVNRFAGDPARNESYFVYGAPVMAVAPGRVLAVRDGMAENTPPLPPDTPGANDDLGNFVLQDLGHGRVAAYAHLRPGSVEVRPGDRLSRGQVLGEVGNTGMSFEPHLHFQVTDRAGLPSGLAANGVPFVFDRFRLDGRHAGLGTPNPVRVPAPPPASRTAQYPLSGDIVAGGVARGA